MINSSLTPFFQVVAHSQGGIIVTNALDLLGEQGVILNNLNVTYYGAAVSEYSATSAINSVGAHIAGYYANPFDAVPNIAGFNTINPFKLVGSSLAIPALFMGPNISPHHYIYGQ